MRPKTKREPAKVYGRGAAKPQSKRGPAFIFSADLQEAAYSLWGRSSEAAIASAMSDRKTRQLLRAEQLRLATQKKARSANEAPAPTSGGFPPLDMKEE
jgi:hypothetical protein